MNGSSREGAERFSVQLVFHATAAGYTFHGPVNLGELIAGAVNEGVQLVGAQGGVPNGNRAAWTCGKTVEDALDGAVCR